MVVCKKNNTQEGHEETEIVVPVNECQLIAINYQVNLSSKQKDAVFFHFFFVFFFSDMY